MTMTKTQVERAYLTLWDKITRGDGYQPFGYDLVTLEACHPGFTEARDRLREEWLAADREEKTCRQSPSV